MAFTEFRHSLIRLYKIVTGLFGGAIPLGALSGPIGITRIMYIVSHQGIGYYIWLLGFLSLNLAVLNALPIPVLDGGHLLFLAIEKVKGSQVSLKVQEAAMYIGLVLILGLVVIAFWNDIQNLLR